MLDKVTKLRDRKKKLIKSIELTKQGKKQVIERAEDLQFQYNSGQISKQIHNKKLKQALENRTLEQWLKYYNDYLAYYEQHLKLCNKLIREEKYGKLRKKAILILIILIVLVVIGILISLLLVFKPAVFDFFQDVGEKISSAVEFIKAPKIPKIPKPPKVPKAPKVPEPKIPPEAPGVYVPMDFEEPEVLVTLKTAFKEIEISNPVRQYQAVLGEPVKWKTSIISDEPGSFEVDLPANSKIIKIKKIEDGREKDITSIADIKKKGIFKKRVEVGVSEIGKEYEIEYETDAPIAFEEELSGTRKKITTLASVAFEEELSGTRKKITISGPKDVHYKNVLAFTEIPEVLKVREGESIRMYQVEENGRKMRRRIKTSVYDTNENGLLDFVEWVVPYLSEASFIIIITKAEHLDENRTFISDIYDEVKELDDNWSELIYHDEYVRVTFEKELNNKNDITFYVRNTQQLNTIVEVYYFDSDEKITEFPVIAEEGEYKVLLTDLPEDYRSDVFDLKIKNLDNNEGAYLEFDYIVDPDIPGCGSEIYYIMSSGTYNLTQDISGISWTCFSIQSDNVILDLNGHSISGVKSSHTYGVYVDDYKNVTIRNGIINSFDIGIWFNSTDKSKIENTIVNNNVDGIWLGSSLHNTLLNNTANNCDQFGIHLYGNSNNNTLINNTVNNNYWYGIYFYDNSDNNYLMNNIANENGYGILFWIAVNNNYIRDSNFSMNIVDDVFLAATSINNTFLNVSYNISKEYVFSASELIRKWYYQAKVNDGADRPMEGVNITVHNRTDDYQFNLTTNSIGYTDITEIIDYINTGTRNYYSNYTTDALKDDYIPKSHSLNVTWESEKGDFGGLIFEEITLEEEIPPDTIPPLISFTPPTPPSQTQNWNSIPVNVSANDVGPVISNISVFIDFDNSLVGWWRMDVGDWCYQETANVETDCGGLDTGDYSEGGPYVYMNYTKPSGVNPRSLWQVKHDDLGPYNVTIPKACWDYDTNKLIFRVKSYRDRRNGESYGECRYGNRADDWWMITKLKQVSNINEEVELNYIYSYIIDENWDTGALWIAGIGGGEGVWGSCKSRDCYKYQFYEEAMIWFNESSDGSVVADYSKNYNDGTIYGGAVQGKGYLGKGFEFDGDGDYVGIPDSNSLDIIGNITLSAWIYPVGSTTHGILSKYNTGSQRSYRLRLNENEGLTLYLSPDGTNYDSASSSNSIVTLNQWNYLTVVWIDDTDQTYFYINGIVDSQKELSSSGIHPGTASLDIGVDYNSANNPFNGIIDDVMIFSRSLSIEEIQALYANTSSKYLFHNFTGLSTGTHTFKAYAQDKGGNVNSIEERTVTIDTTKPKVSITSPLSKTYTTSSIDFNFTLNEAGYCEYTLNSGVTNYTMTANASNTGFNATNPSIADGSYTVIAYCNDTAGNTNYTENVIFSIDATGPTITILAPPDNSNFNQSSVTFNVSLDEAASWCGLSISGAANRTMTPNASSTGFGYASTSIADGSYNFIVSCNDILNNYGASSTYNFYIDTIYPLINFANPTLGGGLTTENDWLFVNVSALDSASSISTFIDFDDSLMGWWRMDDFKESTNTVYDSSSYENHGTAKDDAVQTDAGYLGKGFEFDGIDNYISLGSWKAPFATKDYTISLWFYVKSFPASNTVHYVMWRNDDAPGIRFNRDGTKLFFMVDGNFGQYVYTSVSSDEYIGKWKHVVGTYDGSTARLYISGSLVEQSSATMTDKFLSFSPVRLARDNAPSDRTFNGTIDDVMIFNRALSPEEIIGLYANTAQKYLFHDFTDLSFGTHTFRAYAQDTAGNVNWTEEREVFVNISVAPEIIWVQDIPDVTPLAGGIRNVSFNFTVYDANGFDDLKDNTARANFTNLVGGGVKVRENLTCSHLADFGNYYANYSCLIGMWYFDEPGYWNITAAIDDSEDFVGQNDSERFHYNELSEFDIVPEYINWSDVKIGEENLVADNNIIIRNLGNVMIINIIVNASGLNGVVYVEDQIPAKNFTVANTSIDFCDGSQLIEDENVFVILSLNYSDSTEDEPSSDDIGFCLKQVPFDIHVQDYKSERAWFIDAVFSAIVLSLLKTLEGLGILLAVAIRKKKKKKKKVRKKDILDIFDEKLKEKYIDFEGLLSLDESLREKYDLGVEELLEIAKKEKIKEVEEVRIPVIIFKQGISPAEALCKYLRENLGLRFNEIAKLLNRNERTIWINYRNATRKKKEKIEVEEKILIPIKIFSDRILSILEAIVNYLKKRGFKNREIAEILDKDQRNIYTLYARVKRKLAS